MFCKNCGAEMNDTAKFCPKCGADITGESKKSVEVKEDSTVKFQLKPKFNIMFIRGSYSLDNYNSILDIWFNR